MLDDGAPDEARRVSLDDGSSEYREFHHDRRDRRDGEDVESFDGMTALPGTLETRFSMIDANGNGSNLTMTFEALP